MANSMQWKYSGGFDSAEFATAVSFKVDTELTTAQKDLFVAATAEAASKVLTLGLTDGQAMILANVGGTNAFTAKNVSGDTGTSIGTGKVALVIGSTTANGTKVYVLN